MASESRTAVIAAIAGNACIAVLKFIGAALTGSSSMVSEAIHSTVDTGDQLLLLTGLRRSKRPADENHPFGHGKELYFWSLIVAVLIFGVGGGISVYEGVLHILTPEPLKDPTWNFVILAGSFLFEGTSLVFGLRALAAAEGMDRSLRGIAKAVTTSMDPSVFTVVAEDSAAIVGLAFAAAALGVSHWLGAAWIDGLGSIAIGILLTGVAAFLIYRCRDLLIGQGVSPQTAREIQRVGRSVKYVEQVKWPLTMYFGPNQVFLALNVRFAPAASAAELTAAIEEIEAKIRETVPEVQQIFIEAQGLQPPWAPRVVSKE